MVEKDEESNNSTLPSAFVHIQEQTKAEGSVARMLVVQKTGIGRGFPVASHVGGFWDKAKKSMKRSARKAVAGVRSSSVPETS